MIKLFGQWFEYGPPFEFKSFLESLIQSPYIRGSSVSLILFLFSITVLPIFEDIKARARNCETSATHPPFIAFS